MRKARVREAKQRAEAEERAKTLKIKEEEERREKRNHDQECLKLKATLVADELRAMLTGVDPKTSRLVNATVPGFETRF